MLKMRMENPAFAVPFSARMGSMTIVGVRIFASERKALAQKNAVTDPVMIDAAPHFGGAIPKRGVLFTPSDESFQQLVNEIDFRLRS